MSEIENVLEDAKTVLKNMAELLLTL